MSEGEIFYIVLFKEVQDDKTLNSTTTDNHTEVPMVLMAA
jgi:hypothetical protein